MNRMIALVLSGLALFALVACSSEPEIETVSVELDWSPPNANHSGIYAAIDQGYFEDENLEVEVSVPADAAAIAQLVGAGQRDFGIFYQTDTTLARAAGVPSRRSTSHRSKPSQLANGAEILRDNPTRRPQGQESRIPRYRVGRTYA